MEIASRIDEVLVWRQGATVTRRAEIPAIEGGAQSSRPITIAGLPLSLRDASVRLSLQGEVDARITSVRVTLHAAARADLPIEPDQEALKAAKRALVRSEQRLSLLRAERDLLQEISIPARPDGEEGKPPPVSPMAARVALDTFVDAGTAARDAEISLLRQEIARKTEEVRALEESVRERGAAMLARPEEITKAVHATLEGVLPSGAALMLRYDVPGARWAPVYQIHVSTAGAQGGMRAKLSMRAVIAQATGENWRSVRLVLSTALPEAYTALPKLRSLRIGKAQPEPAGPISFRAPPPGADRLFADFDRERQRLSALAPAKPSGRPFPDPPELPELFVSPRRARPSPSAAASYTEALSASADEDLALDDLEQERTEILHAPAADDRKSRAGAPARSTREVMAPPPPSPRRRSASKKMLEKADKVSEEEEEPREVSEPPSSRLPPFARLSLPAPDAPTRGRLIEQRDEERLWSGLSRGMGFDISEHMSDVEAYAEIVHQRSPPEGVQPVDKMQFDYAWRASEPVDLPSDAGWHTVPVITEEGPCAMRYVVVPREDPSVFRVARLANPLSAPLLAGPVEVYVGGSFQLTSQIPTIAPGETIELGMGVEPAIRCARNTSFEERRSGERVVAMTELHHTLKIELRNTLGRPVDVEVRERIPQPGKDAEVVIDEEQVEPAWESYTQRERDRAIKGGRRWAISLPARATAALSARYVVRIYANNEVVGGNRREG